MVNSKKKFTKPTKKSGNKLFQVWDISRPGKSERRIKNYFFLAIYQEINYIIYNRSGKLKKEESMNYKNAIEELASYIFVYYEERFLDGEEPDEIVSEAYLEDADLLKDLQDLGIDFPIDLESVRQDVEERLWEMYDRKRKENL